MTGLLLAVAEGGALAAEIERSALAFSEGGALAIEIERAALDLTNA